MRKYQFWYDFCLFIFNIHDGPYTLDQVERSYLDCEKKFDDFLEWVKMEYERAGYERKA